MEVKPGYKQSELGVIPTDWEVSPVGKEFSVQLGKMLDTEKNVGVFKPYLGNRAVQWGRINLTEIGSIRMTPTDLKRFRLQKDDLLVCEGGEVGRAAIWNEPIPECYYQKALHRLRPTRGYNVKLMVNVLSHLASQGFLLNFVTQTSIAHLPKDKFETVLIPLPQNKAEQEAIAKALSDADALVEFLEQFIAKKRLIKQGVMQELLTGKRRLQGFEGDWEVKLLGELGSTYGGLTGKTKDDFGDGSASYITFMNIVANVVIDCEAFERVKVSALEFQNRAEKGDLFFNGSSETPEEVAMCAVLQQHVADVYLNSFSFGFRLHYGVEADGLFLAYYLRSEEGRELMKSLAQGSTRYNLSKSALLKFHLRLPGFTEQTAIAEVLSDMDAEIAGLEQRRDKTRALKQGMMQELLTGRIRLV